jgi:hypothetical protein
MAYADGMEDAPVIGTIEKRQPLPQRRPAASEGSTSLAASVRQRS